MYNTVYTSLALIQESIHICSIHNNVHVNTCESHVKALTNAKPHKAFFTTVSKLLMSSLFYLHPCLSLPVHENTTKKHKHCFTKQKCKSAMTILFEYVFHQNNRQCNHVVSPNYYTTTLLGVSKPQCSVREERKCVHVLMRDERKKQARSNKQQGKATQHTQGSHFS